MSIFKTIFGRKAARIWFIVSIVIIAIFTVVTILLSTTFYTVFTSLLGDKRAVYSDEFPAIYVADYESKAKTLEAANKYNEAICEEGFVLLKNENALPIKTPVSDNDVKTKPQISVFGKNSVNLAYGGSGSGGSGSSSHSDLYDSLDAAGYETNPELKKFYEGSQSGTPRPAAPENANLDDGKTIQIPIYETPQSSYTESVKSSYSDYNDAAIIVLTRMGGEGFDLPRSMDGVVGARDKDDHYLQLDQNETDLISAVCRESFRHIIVLLNVGTSMELGFLTDPAHYAYQSKIDAAIWTGFPGNSGIMALGRVLNGEVNPSGRTVDTYVADFKADPTWSNFGDNLKTADSKNKIAGGDQYTIDEGDPTEYYFVDYEEGIYVGYKYYETRGSEDDYWYDNAVIYPFGYGLSYSTFEWEIADKSTVDNAAISGNEKHTIKIKVTNTGTEAGREVVQLYGHAPATELGIEKPYEVLLDFAKTRLLMPGEDDTVELIFDPYYLASYDYMDMNGNNHYGYELEANNNYRLFVNSNAHDIQFKIPFKVAEDILFDKDPVTGNAVVNRYTNCEDSYYDSDNQLNSTMSRYDWNDKWPEPRSAAERETTRDFIAKLTDTAHNNKTDFSEVTIPRLDEDKAPTTFRDMVTDEDGVYGFGEITEGQSIDMSTPFVSYEDKDWEHLINQCDIAELLSMIDNGAFKSAAITSIGKPLTNDTDGPAGFVNFMLKDGTYHGTCYYASQMVVASTWSKEVAKGFGEMVGNEGIWGADGKGNSLPYSGWYAPGVNIHRSPFGGRNFEYCGEDGIFAGKMAAAQIKGCQSKGVYCFIKHFAVNDQETHRSSNGIAVWVTEQAMREIYLKPFEIAVKEGGTRAVMSSFNRIGVKWAGGDYRLLTQILREEWGFRGAVISDFTSGHYMNARQMAYAGGDLNLNNQSTYNWSDFDASNPADVSILRNCAKNIFYTVINSNAMNGEIIGYNMPYWQIWLVIIDCVLGVAIIVWGFFAIRSSIKKSKKQTT